MINIIGYIIIGIVVILIGKKYKSQMGPNSQSLNKGYGKRSDNIKTLLKRIEWVNRYKGRCNYPIRFIIYAVILSILVSILIYDKKLPPITTFIQMVLVLWVALLSLQLYFDHHVDKYAHYYIDKNLKYITKRLKLKLPKDVPTYENNEPLTADCHNFKI